MRMKRSAFKMKRSGLFPFFPKEIYPKTRIVLLFSYIKWRHIKSFNKIKQLIPSQVDLPSKSSPGYTTGYPPQKIYQFPTIRLVFSANSLISLESALERRHQQDDIITGNIPKSLLKLQTSAGTQVSPGDSQF